MWAGNERSEKILARILEGKRPWRMWQNGKKNGLGWVSVIEYVLDSAGSG